MEIMLPLGIFLAKFVMETLATLRIMFLSKGNRMLVPLFGFFEILLWIIVIAEILKNLDNAFCYIAYAAGFAAGSYFGLIMESKLALGNVMIHLITRKKTAKLQRALSKNNYGFAKIAGKDISGTENVIFIVVKRKELKNVVKIIKEFNPNAFYTVENINTVNEGNHPLKSKELFSRFGFSKKLVPEFECSSLKINK